MPPVYTIPRPPLPYIGDLRMSILLSKRPGRPNSLRMPSMTLWRFSLSVWEDKPAQKVLWPLIWSMFDCISRPAQVPWLTRRLSLYDAIGWASSLRRRADSRPRVECAAARYVLLVDSAICCRKDADCQDTATSRLSEATRRSRTSGRRGWPPGCSGRMQGAGSACRHLACGRAERPATSSKRDARTQSELQKKAVLRDQGPAERAGDSQNMHEASEWPKQWFQLRTRLWAYIARVGPYI